MIAACMIRFIRIKHYCRPKTTSETRFDLNNGILTR